jgi:gamma-glutamyltranspeptidase/glutathione hydrolase
MVVAGHRLAAQAALEILEAGGNAVDAGVAAGLALNVVEGEYASFAGVAPIILYRAADRRIVTIDGLGVWPAAASCDHFRRRFGGDIPPGIPRTLVPGAPDAWITALELYGTMGFGEVASAAIRLARDGFVMYPMMAEIIEAYAETISAWPSSAAVLLPGGAVPRTGEVFLQTELARSLQFLVDEERRATRNGREAGLRAARDAFYKGDLAQTIVAFHRENDGLLTAADLAAYRVTVEPPVWVRFSDRTVYGCGPWCQGPMLLQALAILDGVDLAALGHNSPAYVHTVVEALKLAAADREAHYGDPRFHDVPIAVLLSPAYSAERRKLIRPDTAWPGLPPAGLIGIEPELAPKPGRGAVLDTSYLCVVDRWGNACSATPSDGIVGAPIVPGTGLVISPRGGQSWTDPGHPSAVAPGKRPRLTPNPALAIADDGRIMPFGSPGHDVQIQVMLQALLNIAVFGMEPQAAVEAPRFATHSFPSSTMPHASQPGRLVIEAPIGRAVSDALAALGHDVAWWPQSGPQYLQDLSAVCLIERDPATGVLSGGADPRRPTAAAGW